MSGPRIAKRKPDLLILGMWLSLGFGTLAVVEAVSAAVTPGGSIAAQWQRLLSGAFLLVIASGLRSEQPWVRYLVLGYWLVLGLLSVFGLVNAGRLRAAYFVGVASAMALAFAFWYFFVKANVVAYYRTLERKLDAPRA